MKHMAGRKRHSAEDIVRKLRRADELAAEGKTGEEIAAELRISTATLYNWRRTYGGMDTDAAKELKELCEQNARSKRLLAEGRAGEGRTAGGREGKILRPAAKRRVDVHVIPRGCAQVFPQVVGPDDVLPDGLLGGFGWFVVAGAFGRAVGRSIHEDLVAGVDESVQKGFADNGVGE
jgi:putative transposase